MYNHAIINDNREQLAEFCRKWMVTELAVFGSILRDDFGPDSDIDILVTFDTEARWTLFDLATMREELMAIFGREVDLVSRRGLETSRNHLRRQEILSSAEVIYAS
jgi:predicted nucleotidyltransferase